MSGDDRFFRVRVLRIPGWQVAILAAILVALIAAFTIIAAGVLLVVLPVALAAGLAYGFLARIRSPRGRKPSPQEIEVDYEVIRPPDPAGIERANGKGR